MPLLTRCFVLSTQRHPCSRRSVVIFSCHLNNSQSRKLRRFPHVERPPNRARTTHEYRCQPPQLQFNSSCLDFPVVCSLFWPLVTYLANVTVSGPTSRIRLIKTIAPIPGFGLWFLHNPFRFILRPYHRLPSSHLTSSTLPLCALAASPTGLGSPRLPRKRPKQSLADRSGLRAMLKQHQ
jgi:hypothetical protein